MQEEVKLVEKTISFVKKTFENSESGHDWLHTKRIFNNALVISKSTTCNKLIVQLAALLHDIGDSKFYNGDETMAPKMVTTFLTSQNIEKEIIDKVLFIIENMSFRHSFDQKIEKSIEFQIVQDADRLDAIGAIGIARAFSYGGFKKRPFYDEYFAQNVITDSQSYKNSNSHTINHFYEKLLLLKDQMNTPKGKEMAEKRHQFLLDFLEEFYAEIGKQ